MKKYFMLIAFLVGLFALSCSPPVTDSSPQSKTTVVQAADVGLAVNDNVVYSNNAEAVALAENTASSIPIIRADEDVLVPNSPVQPPGGVVGFITNNIAALSLGIMTLLKVIVNLTPTDKDNSIFGVIDKIINWIVPNLKTGGGTHT